MSIHVLRDVEAWFAQYRLRGQMNSCGLKSSIEILDTPTFLDSAKRRTAGLLDTALSLEGYFNEADVGAPANAEIGVMNVPVSIAAPNYDPANAAGHRAYFFQGGFGEFSSGAGVGAADPFSLTITGADGEPLVRGVVGWDQRGVSLDGTDSDHSISLNLGAVAAGRRLCAAVHCLSMDTGDTLDVVIQSSALSSPFTPVTRLTFDQFTQPGAQFKFVDGPITHANYRVSFVVPNVSPAPRVNFVVVLGIS